MTEDIIIPKGRDRVVAERLFGGKMLRQEIRDTRGQERPTTSLPYTTIFRCAARPDPAKDSEDRQIINNNLQLRRIYQNLVREMSFAFVADRAAADSGDDGQDRKFEASGYQVQLIFEQEEPYTVFLLIDVPEGGKVPTTFEVLPPLDVELDDGEVIPDPVTLPTVIDGQIQKLFDRNDPIIKAIANWQQNISIR